MAFLLFLGVALVIAWVFLFIVAKTSGVLVHLLLFVAGLSLIIWALRRPLPRRTTQEP